MAFTFDLQRECTDNYDCVYQTYLAWQQCMTLVASGDGNALYDDAGANIFTQGVNGTGIAGNVCNPDAWALFNSKDSAFQILLKRDTGSGYKTGIYVSPTSAYSLAGAGAATPPTASDEDMIMSEGQSLLVAAGPISSDNPRIVHTIIGDADEDYAFLTFNVQKGYGMASAAGADVDYNLSGAFIDRPTPIDNDDADLRAVFMCFDWTNISMPGACFDARGYGRDDATYGEMALAYTEGIEQKLRQVGLAMPIQRTQFAIYHDRDSGWSGRPYGFGSAWWWALPPYGRYGGVARMLGKSRLFKLHSGATLGVSYRGPLGFTPDQTEAYFGNLVIPWDGGTTPILI